MVSIWQCAKFTGPSGGQNWRDVRCHFVFVFAVSVYMCQMLCFLVGSQNFLRFAKHRAVCSACAEIAWLCITLHMCCLVLCHIYYYSAAVLLCVWVCTSVVYCAVPALGYYLGTICGGTSVVHSTRECWSVYSCTEPTPRVVSPIVGSSISVVWV